MWLVWIEVEMTNLCGTDRFTQLTRNTALFTVRISTQSMLTTETRTQGAFLERIIDGGGLHKNMAQDNAESLKNNTKLQ